MRDSEIIKNLAQEEIMNAIIEMARKIFVTYVETLNLPEIEELKVTISENNIYKDFIGEEITLSSSEVATKLVEVCRIPILKIYANHIYDEDGGFFYPAINFKMKSLDTLIELSKVAAISGPAILITAAITKHQTGYPILSDGAIIASAISPIIGTLTWLGLKKIKEEKNYQKSEEILKEIADLIEEKYLSKPLEDPKKLSLTPNKFNKLVNE